MVTRFDLARILRGLGRGMLGGFRHTVDLDVVTSSGKQWPTASSVVATASARARIGHALGFRECDAGRVR
jgi:hypothetical protein